MNYIIIIAHAVLVIVMKTYKKLNITDFCWKGLAILNNGIHEEMSLI
jgi:hypothetical protein